MPSSRLCTVFTGVFVVCLSVATNAAEPTTSALDAYLNKCDAGYSSTHHMLGMPFKSPGYHSQVPQGTWVHPTRQSLNYAVMLVVRRRPDDLERAELIIRKVLSLQVTDPKHPYYGIWPWLMEESVDQMAPPDRNWADFLGAQLAVLLKQYSDRLSAELNAAMRTSLRHAATEIQDRNTPPSYTNIAIMGGGVCAATGELLDDDQLLNYGRDRLQRCVAHTQHHGSFNEYNSPTYTRVALFEAERALQLIQDKETRQAAEALRRIAWEVIADSFHPGTGQWAGPHSRAYYDFLSDNLAEYLEEQTGAQIAIRDTTDTDPPTIEAIEHLPCPESLRDRFHRLPSDPFEIRRTFIRKANGDDSIVGTTWFTADACLGSVNRSMLWTQRRTMIGYFATEEEPVVVFRQRFLHDGEDFASMGVRNDQQGPRVLSLFEPLRNHGSWHPTLDRPSDGVFTAKDFRVRYELRGRGATARQVTPSLFELRAGDYRVIVHVLPGRFADQDVRWVCKTEDKLAVVDGICYAGEPREFNFKTLADVTIVNGVELLSPEGTAALSGPTLGEDRLTATWAVGDVVFRVAQD